MRRGCGRSCGNIMRKISVILILLGIAILALVACSADEPEPAAEPAPAAPAPAPTTAPAPAPTTAPAPAPATGPKTGGQLRVTSQASIPSLDGVFSGAYVTAALAVHLTHRLFEWNNDLEAKPMLVETFDLSSDGLSWSFKVREGLTFHDGSALDTDDVIRSLKTRRLRGWTAIVSSSSCGNRSGRSLRRSRRRGGADP